MDSIANSIPANSYTKQSNAIEIESNAIQSNPSQSNLSRGVLRAWRKSKDHLRAHHWASGDNNKYSNDDKRINQNPPTSRYEVSEAWESLKAARKGAPPRTLDPLPSCSLWSPGIPCPTR